MCIRTIGHRTLASAHHALYDVLDLKDFGVVHDTSTKVIMSRRCATE